MIKFYDPIYRTTYYFSSKDQVKLQKKLFKEVIDDCDSLGKFFYKDNEVFIWVKDFKINPDKLGVLSHEVNHAVDHILNWAGVEDTEAKSYYAEFITKSILNGHLKSLKRVRKDKMPPKTKGTNKK